MSGDEDEPKTDFEGTRIPVSFFRVAPPKPKPVAEQYTSRRFLQVNLVGGPGLVPWDVVILLAPADGLSTSESTDISHLLTARMRHPEERSYDEREHIKGALQNLIHEIDDIDRSEANEKTGRHAEHHNHVLGNQTECSCGVKLGMFSVAYPHGAPNWDQMACSICGQQGLVSAESYWGGGGDG